MQRLDPRDAATTVAYTKAMGLNTIRLEGTLGNRALYAAADRAGVMIMPGFVCCSIWQNDQRWTTDQANVAAASLDSQMRALRAHASAFMWAFGSDCPVNGPHLRRYKRIAARLHWQNPTVDGVATWCDSNAGMKMDGPYAWVPPVLWWDTGRAGSAFGTTAEEGTQIAAAAGDAQELPAPEGPVADRRHVEPPCGAAGQHVRHVPLDHRRDRPPIRPCHRVHRLLREGGAAELRDGEVVLRGVERA